MLGLAHHPSGSPCTGAYVRATHWLARERGEESVSEKEERARVRGRSDRERGCQELLASQEQ
jgi:hypothetical protein